MRKGRCKHLNGTFHNTHCDAGVAYRDVVTEPDRMEGIAWRYPCSDMARLGATMSPYQAGEYAKRGTCPKYADPTDEEIAEDQARVKAAVERLRLTAPLISEIKRNHKGKNWQGIVTCPVCKGRLHISHAAYNGHVWGACETEGCLNWVE